MFSRIKIILIACIVLVTLTGIYQTAAGAAEQDLRTAMQGLIEGLNAHDMAQINLHFTDDIAYDFVPQPPVLNGKEQLAAFFEGLFAGIRSARANR